MNKYILYEADGSIDPTTFPPVDVDTEGRYSIRVIISIRHYVDGKAINDAFTGRYCYAGFSAGWNIIDLESLGWVHVDNYFTKPEVYAWDYLITPANYTPISARTLGVR